MCVRQITSFGAKAEKVIPLGRKCSVFWNSVGKWDEYDDITDSFWSDGLTSSFYVLVPVCDEGWLTFTFDPIPQISRMHHQNLAEFIGLSLTGSNYQVVYERPVKGDVLMLVSTSVIFADMDIRLTLMANIVQVRNFILMPWIKVHVILKSAHFLHKNW